MIIISQGKDELVNFDRIESIWICADEEGRFTIEATADTNFTLATYSTEERAKEVLKDIISRYEVIELFKMNSSEKEGYTLSDYTPIYEMPEE